MSKQRTSKEISKNNVRRPKVTRSFKLGDKWVYKDGSDYNILGKLRLEMNSNPMKSESDKKEKLGTMPSTKKELKRWKRTTKR